MDAQRLSTGDAALVAIGRMYQDAHKRVNVTAALSPRGRAILAASVRCVPDLCGIIAPLMPRRNDEWTPGAVPWWTVFGKSEAEGRAYLHGRRRRRRRFGFW